MAAAALDSMHPAQRNPISFLHELCLAKDVTAVYKLLSVEGPVHEPTFTFSVEVDGIVFTATGSSKQKAKHAVAKAALEKLLSKDGKYPEGFEADGTLYTYDMLQEFSNATAVVPVKESVPNTDNPVGELQEACTRLKWTAPYYEKVEEFGLPHEREFEFYCMIRTDTGEEFKEYAKDKSKKLAKRLAAQKMVKTLKEKGFNVDRVPSTRRKEIEESYRHACDTSSEITNGTLSANDNGDGDKVDIDAEADKDILEKLKVTIVNSNSDVKLLD